MVSTNASGTPLASVGTGGPGSDHAVRLDLKTIRCRCRWVRSPTAASRHRRSIGGRRLGRYRAVNPALAPWRIASGSVNVQTYWPAAEGRQTLDLNGISPGTIEQSFATTPGQVYQLAFDYGNNPDARDRRPGHGDRRRAGTLLSQQIAHAGSTPRDMKYTHFSGTLRCQLGDDHAAIRLDHAGRLWHRPGRGGGDR